jgi:hypothetical protein
MQRLNISYIQLFTPGKQLCIGSTQLNAEHCRLIVDIVDLQTNVCVNAAKLILVHDSKACLKEKCNRTCTMQSNAVPGTTSQLFANMHSSQLLDLMRPS